MDTHPTQTDTHEDYYNLHLAQVNNSTCKLFCQYSWIPALLKTLMALSLKSYQTCNVPSSITKPKFSCGFLDKYSISLPYVHICTWSSTISRIILVEAIYNNYQYDVMPIDHFSSFKNIVWTILIIWNYIRDMAFPEWCFILIPTLPCLVINFSYTMVLWFLITFFWCCNCLNIGKYKWFEKLNGEVRSLLPLFKQGSSPNELLLFNFRVQNSRYFVLIVNCSVIYVVLIAAAIFFQTAFVEEAQCSPVNSYLFCYLNGSSVGCSEFDYSLKTANCYGITVRFGDAAKVAAGVFSFLYYSFWFTNIHSIEIIWWKNWT